MSESFSAGHNWKDENGLAGIRHVLPKKINERILRQRQQTYFDKRLCYLQCFSLFFFFWQRLTKQRWNRLRDRHGVQFPSAPVLLWRAKPYSALSFDRVNFFSMAHFFSLSRKPFVMCYCFREPIQLSFLTPVKWLSNRVSCSFFRSPKQEAI